MRVNAIPIQNFDKRMDGLLKVNLSTLPLPSDFLNRHQMMIYIPPKQLAANHKHRRREIFISLSDNVELHWVDGDGMTHINKMKEDNQLYLFDIPPFVPHAIINLSQDSAAVLLEFADNLQHASEPYPVILMLNKLQKFAKIRSQKQDFLPHSKINDENDITIGF